MEVVHSDFSRPNSTTIQENSSLGVNGIFIEENEDPQPGPSSSNQGDENPDNSLPCSYQYKPKPGMFLKWKSPCKC